MCLDSKANVHNNLISVKSSIWQGGCSWTQCSHAPWERHFSDVLQLLQIVFILGTQHYGYGEMLLHHDPPLRESIRRTCSERDISMWGNRRSKWVSYPVWDWTPWRHGETVSNISPNAMYTVRNDTQKVALWSKFLKEKGWPAPLIARLVHSAESHACGNPLLGTVSTATQRLVAPERMPALEVSSILSLFFSLPCEMKRAEKFRFIDLIISIFFVSLWHF